MAASTVTDWDALPVTMSVADACRALGICKQTVLRQVAAGAIPHVRSGRRILIGREMLRRWSEGRIAVPRDEVTP